MGLLLSRFRKKKSSAELLEDIQNNISKLENKRQYSLQREKFIVGRLVIYSILMYIVAAASFYFFFFPASLRDRIFYIIPLLIFPIVVFFLKRIVTWIYKSDIVRSENKLAGLIEKRKQILDDVMNKETYKKAKEILDKYAPTKPKFNTETVLQTPAKKLKIPETPQRQDNQKISPTPLQIPSATSTPRRIQSTPPLRPIRPILPRDRSYFDKLIEAFVGDGPSNRYALICKNCAAHNGMALKEEFEYLAFRCAYCGFPNPSLKVRPRNLPFGFTPLQSIPKEGSEQRKIENDKSLESESENKETVGNIETVENEETLENEKTVENLADETEFIERNLSPDLETESNTIENLEILPDELSSSDSKKSQ